MEGTRSWNLHLFLFSFVFVCSLQNYFMQMAPDGLHIQQWDSDTMMQTLPAAQLKKTPLQSLRYLHIQPPALDAVRALAAQFISAPSDAELLRRLDRVLYIIWAALYALLSLLVFHWVKNFTGYAKFALGAWFFWLIHPSPLYYSALLEGTNMSAVLITWFLYEFWQISRNPERPRWRVLVAAVLLAYTRSLFQWYFYPLFLMACWLTGWKQQDLVKAAAVLVIFTAPLFLHRLVLFDTLATVSFSGYSKTGILWYQPTTSEIEQARKNISFQYPQHAAHYSGNDPFNTERQYEDNLIYSKIASEKTKQEPVWTVKKVLKSLTFNWKHYWGPSSAYAYGAPMVNMLPWKQAYDVSFSGSRFMGLLMLALAAWICLQYKSGNLNLKNLKAVAAVGMLIGYTLLISNLCNRFEWTEAIRMKYLLEPVFYIFIVSQLFLARKAFGLVIEKIKKAIY